MFTRSGGFGGPGERTTHRLYGNPIDTAQDETNNDVNADDHAHTNCPAPHRTTYAEFTQLGTSMNGLATSLSRN